VYQRLGFQPHNAMVLNLPASDTTDVVPATDAVPATPPGDDSSAACSEPMPAVTMWQGKLVQVGGLVKFQALVRGFQTRKRLAHLLSRSGATQLPPVEETIIKPQRNEADAGAPVARLRHKLTATVPAAAALSDEYMALLLRTLPHQLDAVLGLEPDRWADSDWGRGRKEAREVWAEAEVHGDAAVLRVLVNTGVGQDVKDAVVQVQCRHGLYVNPAKNWYTDNVRRFGKGFDMKKLTADPGMLAAKFDRLSTKYDHWVVGNRSKVSSWLAAAVLGSPRALLEPTSHALDVACGVGIPGLTLRLCGFQGRITGTDISPGMLDQASTRGCYDELLAADSNDGLAEIASESVDLVVCTGAMELLDHKRALGAFARVLKPGGVLWVSFQDQVTPCPTLHQNVHGITVQKARVELEEAGFHAPPAAMARCEDAFYTPHPAQDGSSLPVPYTLWTVPKAHARADVGVCAG